MPRLIRRDWVITVLVCAPLVLAGVLAADDGRETWWQIVAFHVVPAVILLAWIARFIRALLRA